MRFGLLAAVAGVLLAPATAPAATPTPTTGRLLVTLKAPGATTAQASAARAVIAEAPGARAARLRIPQLRLVAVRARGGTSLHNLATRLRADPRVRSVRAERRFRLRYVPNDAAFSTPERGENGTVTEWWAAREGLPAAWDTIRSDAARVAVIDTGVDATHP